MIKFQLTKDGCVEIYSANGNKLGEIRPLDVAFAISSPRHVGASLPYDEMHASISVSGKSINTLLITVA